MNQGSEYLLREKYDIELDLKPKRNRFLNRVKLNTFGRSGEARKPFNPFYEFPNLFQLELAK